MTCGCDFDSALLESPLQAAVEFARHLSVQRIWPTIDAIADAWSRTYRSRAVTFAGTADAQQTRNGLRILPQQVAAGWPAERLLPAIGDQPPAKALDQALFGIEARYGMRTVDFVAMQLEYPRHSAPH